LWARTFLHNHQTGRNPSPYKQAVRFSRACLPSRRVVRGSDGVLLRECHFEPFHPSGSSGGAEIPGSGVGAELAVAA